MKTEQLDEWKRDPAVRAMRNIFAQMESVHVRFLDLMHISPYDSRLRKWREKGLEMFERVCASAAQRGVMVDAKTAGDIYVHSLARVMSLSGIEVDKGLLPENSGVQTLVKKFLG